jgi:Uma2 family endonuclease
MISVMIVEPATHVFTVDEYERMGEVGLFAPDQRLELVAGEIVEMTPIGSPHASTVTRLCRWFDRRVGDRAIVIGQNPVRISDVTEPQPDLTLVRWRDDFYRSAHPRPEDVLLLIEVSDSTARWDRRVKRPLYAVAGVPEVWIVDLQAQVVEVATEPTATGYRQVEQVTPGHIVVPRNFPDLRFPVQDLFD